MLFQACTINTHVYQTLNQDIKGVVVEDKEMKCIAFADDLTNLIRDI